MRAKEQSTTDMTRIDFYSLKEDSRGDRFLLTCRLAERIHAQRLRAYIHAPDTQHARHIDRLLWTYKKHSFIPHGLAAQADREWTPILIGSDGDPGDEHQVLVNLGAEVPAFFERFDRLLDLVDLDPGVKQAGRMRFRYYRDQGYAPEHHQIKL